MKYMFAHSTDFNQTIEAWDVSQVENMESMFYQCPEFNQSVDKWNIRSVTNMNNMFNYAYKFDQCLSTWDSKMKGRGATFACIFEYSGCWAANKGKGCGTV